MQYSQLDTSFETPTTGLDESYHSRRLTPTESVSDNYGKKSNRSRSRSRSERSVSREKGLNASRTRDNFREDNNLNTSINNKLKENIPTAFSFKHLLTDEKKKGNNKNGHFSFVNESFDNNSANSGNTTSNLLHNNTKFSIDAATIKQNTKTMKMKKIIDKTLK